MEQPTNNTKNDQLQIPEEIIRQILVIRDLGVCNMFDIITVRRVAYEEDLIELLDYLSERAHREAYIDFILYGKRSQKK